MVLPIGTLVQKDYYKPPIRGITLPIAELAYDCARFFCFTGKLERHILAEDALQAPLPAILTTKSTRKGLRMINVIIADDQAIFRAGAAKILAVEEDIRIVGQPQSSEQLLNALEKLRSHVLLFAASYLPFYSEIQRVALGRGTALLMLADNDQPASNYMQMGMQGVIFRSVTGETIVAAVRKLARGEQFVQTPVHSGSHHQEDFVGARVRARLSPKELRIVAAIVRGFKNREIADMIGTSEQVIKNALRAIYDKIGVNDRLELALFVLHHRSLTQATAAVHLQLERIGESPQTGPIGNGPSHLPRNS